MQACCEHFCQSDSGNHIVIENGLLSREQVTVRVLGRILNEAVSSCYLPNKQEQYHLKGLAGRHTHRHPPLTILAVNGTGKQWLQEEIDCGEGMRID